MSNADATHRPALGSHRLLGEGVGAALLMPDGEIDWWCPDRFDADPVLWSLLDRAGARSRWRGADIASWDACPAGPTAHTTVRVGDRRVELWDGLVALEWGSALIRLVRPCEGRVSLTHELSAGGWGTDQRSPRTTRDGIATAGLTLVGDAGVRTSPDGVVVDAESQTWHGFAVCTAKNSLIGTADELVTLLCDAETRSRSAMSSIRLPRDHPSRATDALRVLRALTDQRSGAPVAAPTTSLPEAPGGERQFDYRYSWLRDSALALSTAVMLGHLRAGERFLEFVVELVDRVNGHLEPLTTSAGDHVPAERTVEGVAGWAGSRPVRVGNAATQQRQVDAVAAVIDAIWTFANHGGRVDGRCWGVVDRLATLIAASPWQPTSGVWEFREPRLLVSEELARWQGLDRAIRLRRRYRPWLRRPAWQRQRRLARQRVEAVVDDATGRLPQTFDVGDTTPDAATLLVPVAGFWRRRDPRLRRLVDATISALEEGAFLRRYPPADDGFAGTEGAFVPASWWAVTALATCGEIEAARARADVMCAALPPLQPEEWDAASNLALGNTPLRRDGWRDGVERGARNATAMVQPSNQRRSASTNAAGCSRWTT
jgi:hypothetical protein